MSESVQVGSILEGKVIKIKPFGAIVSLADGVQGLVHISQISESFVRDINDSVVIGDVVKVKVLSKDEENGKITLSIKAASPSEGERPRAQDNSKFEKRGHYEDSQRQKPGEMTFDEKLKDWIKQSNERQAGINKRNNRR